MSMKHLLNTKRRVFLGGAVKSIDSEKRTIRAYASTSAWDRYEERFEPDAFAGDGMKNYLKNPVVLFAHDYSQAPIAKCVAHEFDAKGLILTMEFAETEKAKEVFALYEGGFMNAFSVGFRPLEVAYEERTPGGRMGVVYKRAELLENSAVPVPANPEAVVIKGLGDKTHQVSGEMLRSFMEAGFDARERMPRPNDAIQAASETTVEDYRSVAESLEKAKEWLKKAIDRHERHMNGTEATDEKSQQKMMDEMKKAYSLLGGEMDMKSSKDFAAKEGEAPDLKTTLEYLLGLAKMVRAKGKKVEGEELRNLLIQSVNLFRELIYGPGSPKVEHDGEPLTAEAKTALVAEYEAMVEALSVDATPEELKDLEKVAELIEKEISRE